MLDYSLVVTVSGRYAGLPEIGTATQQMLPRNSDVTLGQGGSRTDVKAFELMAALDEYEQDRGTSSTQA